MFSEEKQSRTSFPMRQSEPHTEAQSQGLVVPCSQRLYTISRPQSRIAHTHFQILGHCVARWIALDGMTVVFEIVESPFGDLACVLVLMTERTRIAVPCS